MITVLTPLFYCFASLDTMINVWCLILYDQRYNALYLKLFGQCANPKKVEMELSDYIKNNHHNNHKNHK